jgi:hypothetical protein
MTSRIANALRGNSFRICENAKRGKFLHVIAVTSHPWHRCGDVVSMQILCAHRLRIWHAI